MTSRRRLRPKANYAGQEDGVELEWNAGAYRCVDSRFETESDRVDRQQHEAQANQVFLATLDSLTEQRRATSASKQATNYAPRLMTDSGLVVGFNKNDLERAMQRLFKIGVIIADAELWRRKNRHSQTGIGRKE